MESDSGSVFQVLASAYPWIARRLLTDTDPVLRETLESLLYRNGKFQFHRLESLLVQAVKSPARAPMVAQLDTGKGSSARRSGGRSTGIASRDTRNGGLPPPG